MLVKFIQTVAENIFKSGFYHLGDYDYLLLQSFPFLLDRANHQHLSSDRSWPNPAVRLSIAGCKGENLATASAGCFRPEADLAVSLRHARLPTAWSLDIGSRTNRWPVRAG